MHERPSIPGCPLTDAQFSASLHDTATEKLRVRNPRHIRGVSAVLLVTNRVLDDLSFLRMSAVAYWRHRNRRRTSQATRPRVTS